MIKIVHVYKGNGEKLKNSVVDAQIDSIKDNSLDSLAVQFPPIISGKLYL